MRVQFQYGQGFFVDPNELRMQVFKVIDRGGLWGEIAALNEEQARHYLQDEIYPKGSLEEGYELLPTGGAR